MNEKHHTSPENAPKLLDWIKTRGGVAVWKSINLSNPSDSWSTPLKDPTGFNYERPNWQCGAKPSLVITNPANVVVDVPKEWKRFHVGLRRTGLSVKLTDAASNRVWNEKEKCFNETGKGCWHEFDYEAQDCIIKYADQEIPLLEFLK